MKGLHPAWKTNEDWDPEKSEGWIKPRERHEPSWGEGEGTMGWDDGDNKFPGITLTLMRKS